MAFRVVNKVPDDEKVVHKPHAVDHVKLIPELRFHLARAGLAVAPDVPFAAEAREIGKAVCFPLRELIFRQVVVAELEIVMAARGDLLGDVRGLRLFGEECAHLLPAFEIKLGGGKLHRVGIVHGLAGLDAEKGVLISGVFLINIMRVVRHDERDARFAREAAQSERGLALVRDAVILNFQEKVLAEQLAQLKRFLLCALVIVRDDVPGEISRETAGKTDQPLGVLMQQRPVDARLDVKPVRKAAGDKIAEIPVADVVFAQKDEMGILVVDAVLTVKAGARRNVYLAADDRADALGKTRAVKRDRAVHHAVVRDGERRLSQLLGAARELLDAAGAVQQGVFRMHVQMDKAHISLLCTLIASLTGGSCSFWTPGGFQPYNS